MTISDPATNTDNEDESVASGNFRANLGEDSPDLFSESDTILMSDDDDVVNHPDAIFANEGEPKARSTTPTSPSFPPIPPMPPLQPNSSAIPANQPVSGIVGNAGI